MPKNSSWVNSDGLVVGFGTQTSTQYSPAIISDAGSERVMHLPIPAMASLGTDATTGTGIYQAQNWMNAAMIPGGAIVTEVKIVTKTGCTSGGAADLLIGTYTISSTTGLLVAVDADGLLAAGDAALADFDTAGETRTYAIAAGAAQLGKTTVGANPVTVAPTYVTAAYTAGALDVYIKFVV